MFKATVVQEFLAVVRGEHDDGRAFQSHLVDGFDQTPYFVIRVGNFAVV